MVSLILTESLLKEPPEPKYKLSRVVSDLWLVDLGPEFEPIQVLLLPVTPLHALTPIATLPAPDALALLPIAIPFVVA